MKLRKRLNKQYIPSVFTLTNLFLGFLAIISIVDGYTVRAAYLIIAAGAFDILDGKLARWIQVPSRFGTELDSLADVVSFCFAPALLVWSQYARDMHPVLGALIAGAPLYFGAVRLARYNAGQNNRPQPYFEGLPSPMNALAIVALVLYYVEHGQGGAAKVVLPVVMATSFLMISQVRYTKSPRFSFRAGWGNTIYLIAVIAAVAAWFWQGNMVLLPVLLLYILSGLVRWLTRTDIALNLRSAEKEA